MDKLTMKQKHKLLKQLQEKLANIPTGHLPSLSLTDVIEQAPKVLALPHIPPDLQLDFFLANRSLINENNSLAVQPGAQRSEITRTQLPDITRAIFYYRLDDAHQFYRYHDSHRWNMAIFLALLAEDHTTAEPSERNLVLFPPAARNFVVSYLEAVMENHYEPTVFKAREAFINRWRISRFDFFLFSSGQKRPLKTQMKRLSAAWPKELDRVRAWLGPEEYEKRVAKFVGVLFPGRVESRVPRYPQADEMNPIEKAPGTLLAALETPLGQPSTVRPVRPTDTNRYADTLTRKREAIDILKRSEPWAILQRLMLIFPPEEEIYNPKRMVRAF